LGKRTSPKSVTSKHSITGRLFADRFRESFDIHRKLSLTPFLHKLRSGGTECCFTNLKIFNSKPTILLREAHITPHNLGSPMIEVAPFPKKSSKNLVASSTLGFNFIKLS
jgi:hypothetical protein